MTPAELAAIFRTVPPGPKLRIYGLAWELVDKEGRVDISKVTERLPDLNLAEAEARTHMDGIAKLRDALNWLMRDGHQA